MQTEVVAFTNRRGQRIAARLDRPDGTARAFALFAHCFTCDKTSKAAVRISHALAGLGLAVLRFDFTGLGESDGELTGFSADVQDVIDAAAHMAGQGMAPALLIGHSLGGAAVLAAAGDVALGEGRGDDRRAGRPGSRAEAVRREPGGDRARWRRRRSRSAGDRSPCAATSSRMRGCTT